MLNEVDRQISAAVIEHVPEVLTTQALVAIPEEYQQLEALPGPSRTASEIGRPEFRTSSVASAARSRWHWLVASAARSGLCRISKAHSWMIQMFGSCRVQLMHVRACLRTGPILAAGLVHCVSRRIICSLHRDFIDRLSELVSGAGLYGSAIFCICAQ